MNLIQFECSVCGRPTSAYEGTIRAEERLCRVCRLEQSLAASDPRYVRLHTLTRNNNPNSLKILQWAMGRCP